MQVAKMTKQNCFKNISFMLGRHTRYCKGIVCPLYATKTSYKIRGYWEIVTHPKL